MLCPQEDQKCEIVKTGNRFRFGRLSGCDGDNDGGDVDGDVDGGDDDDGDDVDGGDIRENVCCLTKLSERWRRLLPEIR